MTAELGDCLPQIRSIGMMAFDPIWAQRDHCSSGLELLHVVNGTVRLLMDGVVWEAGPGETLMIPPGTVHRDEFDVDAGLELFFCTLEWPPAAQFFAHVDNRVLLDMPARWKAQVSTLFDQLRADGGATAGDLLVARARVHTILLLAWRAATATAEPDAAWGPQRRRALMLAAKEYLGRNYAGCLTLDDIAAALDVSPYYLSHVFSAESDFSLFAYLTALRMQKAQALLREEQLTVAEVGQAVGYDNANYFSKVFRRHVGCAPREFAAAAVRQECVNHQHRENRQ